MDICQSVMAQFFVHVTQGQFDLHAPTDLVRVLVVMVRNKVIDQTRRQQAQRRDQRLMIDDGQTDLATARTNEPSPASHVANQDLVALIRERLSPREREIADARHAGKSWPEIAAELNMDAEALRKTYSRALDRVASELDVEDLQ